MVNTKDRLLTSQWLFERQVGWVAAAEIKVGVVVAINTAMLGGLAAAFGSSPNHLAWGVLMGVIATVCSAASMLCAVAAVFPRLAGPRKSLLFFGKISELSAADYIATLGSATDEQLLADWAEQIHRNAEIAMLKHGWVKKAMAWSFGGAIPWIASVFLLLKI